MRHYTVDEANSLLASLVPVLEDLQRLKVRMDDAVRHIHHFEKRAKSNGHGEGAPALQDVNDVESIGLEIQKRLYFFERQSIQVKDVERGIIDFPTRRGDADVLLCWRLGERQVTHWHAADEGFAGRKPL